MIFNKRKYRKHLRSFTISPHALALVFRTGGEFAVESGIPNEAKVIGTSYNPFRYLIHLLIEHKSFELVGEGELVPESQIRIRKLK